MSLGVFIIQETFFALYWTYYPVAPPFSTIPLIKNGSTLVPMRIDGDAIEVTFNNGTVEKVRLIGVYTPEAVHPNTNKNSEDGKLTSDYTKQQL